ncbi:hypothetical protein [Nocardioides jensenii]|uniref:hypothetical protein n=1 Tax=Nocardioides jensenii TaxID=1843 RepID=UPI00082ED8A6|nr:hypothetical protein [Nocardioides jensenii]
MGKPARCRSCAAALVFFKHPSSPKQAPFDAKPIDGHHPNTANAYPVVGASAYRPLHLAEQIQVRDHISDVEAMAEVRDMQWFHLHVCQPTTPKETD